MGKYSLLATASLMFNVISFSSLLFNIYKTQNVSSFNWLYLIGNTMAQILLILYGIVNNAPEIYGPTVLLFVGLLYIVYVKFTT
jgi:uncharacterized protein with PQ loop repeat